MIINKVELHNASKTKKLRLYIRKESSHATAPFSTSVVLLESGKAKKATKRTGLVASHATLEAAREQFIQNVADARSKGWIGEKPKRPLSFQLPDESSPTPPSV